MITIKAVVTFDDKEESEDCDIQLDCTSECKVIVQEVCKKLEINEEDFDWVLNNTGNEVKLNFTLEQECISNGCEIFIEAKKIAKARKSGEGKKKEAPSSTKGQPRENNKEKEKPTKTKGATFNPELISMIPNPNNMVCKQLSEFEQLKEDMRKFADEN